MAVVRRPAPYASALVRRCSCVSGRLCLRVYLCGCVCARACVCLCVCLCVFVWLSVCGSSQVSATTPTYDVGAVAKVSIARTKKSTEVEEAKK